MVEFKRVVLKDQLQITLHELEKEGAQDVKYVECSNGQVEVTALLPNPPRPKPARLTFGSRKRN